MLGIGGKKGTMEEGTGGRGAEGTYIFGAGEVHDLVEGLPAVILADGVALLVADVVVGRHEDADRVGLCAASAGSFARGQPLWGTNL